MIAKQSIRKGTTIYYNGREVSKDEVIQLTKDFTERQENLFRKMLTQGGILTIQGIVFEIKTEEPLYDSKGEIATAYVSPFKNCDDEYYEEENNKTEEND
jgi:hypothetical protein